MRPEGCQETGRPRFEHEPYLQIIELKTVSTYTGPVKSPRTLAGVAALVAPVLMVLTATTPLFSQAIQRNMFVSVVDQSGAPVPDLGLGDFIIREDNLSR